MTAPTLPPILRTASGTPISCTLCPLWCAEALAQNIVEVPE